MQTSPSNHPGGGGGMLIKPSMTSQSKSKFGFRIFYFFSSWDWSLYQIFPSFCIRQGSHINMQAIIVLKHVLLIEILGECLEMEKILFKVEYVQGSKWSIKNKFVLRLSFNYYTHLLIASLCNSLKSGLYVEAEDWGETIFLKSWNRTPKGSINRWC